MSALETLLVFWKLGNMNSTLKGKRRPFCCFTDSSRKVSAYLTEGNHDLPPAGDTAQIQQRLSPRALPLNIAFTHSVLTTVCLSHSFSVSVGTRKNRHVPSPVTGSFRR